MLFGDDKPRHGKSYPAAGQGAGDSPQPAQVKTEHCGELVDVQVEIHAILVRVSCSNVCVVTVDMSGKTISIITIVNQSLKFAQIMIQMYHLGN